MLTATKTLKKMAWGHIAYLSNNDFKWTFKRYCRITKIKYCKVIN